MGDCFDFESVDRAKYSEISHNVIRFLSIIQKQKQFRFEFCFLCVIQVIFETNKTRQDNASPPGKQRDAYIRG
jgi:hypothetical protein